MIRNGIVATALVLVATTTSCSRNTQDTEPRTSALRQYYARQVAQIEHDDTSADRDTAVAGDREAAGEVVDTDAMPSGPGVHDKPIDLVLDVEQIENGRRVKSTFPLIPDPDDVDNEDIRLSKRVELTLYDAIRRALEHSFALRVQAYEPAISVMDVVQAEAAFDAVLQSNLSWTELDTPTASELQGSYSDTRVWDMTVSKLLATGATASFGYNVTRQRTNLQFVTVNPSYDNNWVSEIRQPLLRGFGVDVNRAGIDMARYNSRAERERFRRQVRETIFNVERAYWELRQARVEVAIRKQLIEQTQATLDMLEKRKQLDTLPVELSRTTALLRQREADYVAVRNNVRDAEDTLKNLMNDPKLNQGEYIEIIPIEPLATDPMIIDRIAELKQALEHREELKEAELALAAARVSVARMRNQALPRLDLLFSYTINGLGSTWSRAFDQTGDLDFEDYTVGLTFEYPIGNRAARADQRRAELQRDQARDALKQTVEQVILEVDTAVRALQASYEALNPSVAAASAAYDNLQVIEARKTTLDPTFLDLRLSAQETLATSRSAVLQALVQYNTAIVQLERAKGTLLEYNNIMLADRTADPAQPVQAVNTLSTP